MDNKKEKNNTNQNQLREYFNDVEIFSKEHLQDINKFSRLLESMKNSQKSSDKRIFVEVHQILNKFNYYMKNNNVHLNDAERNEISSITGAKLAPPVIKRMLEDLLYKIKNRHHNEQIIEQEQKKVISEINELNSTKNKFLNWIRITKFSLDYGTITLFSHKLKDSTLSIIRNKVSIWQELIQKGVQNILDNEYYILSTMEYNSIESMLQLKEPIEQIKAVKWSYSYHPLQISSQIDLFATIYITMIKNALLIDKAIKKAFKNKKLPHGLYGILMDILDQPIYNNTPVQLSLNEKIQNTITGLLLSYYTCRKGIIIKSIEQIMYIISVDGKLDGKKKHLTAYAIERESSVHDQKNSEKEILINKLKEIERITNSYLIKAPEIEDKIYMIEARSLYTSWLAENNCKPILRFKRLIDGFIKYFVDVINDDSRFILFYDNNDFRNYFEYKNYITDIVSHFNLFEFDLAGSSLKETINLSLPPDTTPRQFVYTLTTIDVFKSAFTPELNQVRTALLKIADKSYQLAQKLNELITFYYNQKEIIHTDTTQNYDFFLNAQVKKGISIKTHLVLKKDEITLIDFLEAACSLAFYIAHELNHPSILAISKEKENIQKKIKSIEDQSSKSNDNQPNSNQTDIENDDTLLEAIDELYVDPITGLKKRNYLEEQIIPKLYDNHKKYKYNIPRFVFCCKINDIRKYNDDFGHDVGDHILYEISRIIDKQVTSPGTANNITLKYSSDRIIGYINDTNLTSAVEILLTSVRDINSITIKSEGFHITSLSISFGIYEEREGTNIYDNINIAEKIMNYVNNPKQNCVGFVKNQNKVISINDFSRLTDLSDIISFLY